MRECWQSDPSQRPSFYQVPFIVIVIIIIIMMMMMMILMLLLLLLNNIWILDVFDILLTINKLCNVISIYNISVRRIHKMLD